MRRRHALLVPWAAAAFRVRAEEDARASGPRHKISAATLFEALSARFPLRTGVPGLLELELDSPRLLLLPARNQLGAGVQVHLRGVPLPPQAQSGDVEIAFGLRYEKADRTVRAVRPELLAMDWPGLRARDAQTAQNLLAALLREVDEVVLQRLSERELALPLAMGLQPQALRVVDDGVLVLFANAPPR